MNTEAGIYEGEMQNGVPHGRGVLIYANGDRYEGELQNGEMHGHGVYITPDGDRCEGEWENDGLIDESVP